MGEERNLARAIAEPAHVIQVKVLQLVRADLLLGTLRRTICISVCVRHQLRGDLRIEDRLQKCASRRVKLPGLNHLFQASKTGALSEYQQIEETINPAALEVVGDWLAKRAAAK